MTKIPMNLLKITTAATLALLGCGALHADTPLQYGQNLSRNAVVLAKDLPAHLGDDNCLWKIDLHGKPFFNAVQIDGDRGYAAMDARNLPERSRARVAGLLCFDIHTGEILWQKVFEDVDVDAYGASMIPILKDDKIYMSVQRTAMCLDKEGNVLWKTNIQGPWWSGMHSTHGTGIVLGDYWWLLTGYSNGSDCGNWMSNSIERPHHPNIVVVEKATGKIVAQDDVILGPHQHGTWASLTYGEPNGRPTVFWADSHGMLHAFKVPEKFDVAEDGTPATIEDLWTIDANPKEYRVDEDGDPMPYAGYMGGHFGPQDIGWCEVIGPVVYKDAKVYVSLARDVAYTPKVDGRRIANGGVVCVDVSGAEPKKLWHNKDVGRTFCPVSVVDGMAFVADHAGYMTGINIDTGETLWHQDMNTSIWNYFQCYGDGKIYTANERSDFIIFEGDADGGLVFNTQMDSTNNPQVGMTDGILIVPTMKSIAAYGGPEYMKTAQPMTPPEDPDDRQFGHGEPGQFDTREVKTH